jgi:hypothetical protein
MMIGHSSSSSIFFNGTLQMFVQFYPLLSHITKCLHSSILFYNRFQTDTIWSHIFNFHKFSIVTMTIQFIVTEFHFLLVTQCQ